MSGLEAAGLILGAFPLLISAWSSYKANCEPFTDWWRFEQVLANLIRPVICEEVLFRLNLEKLLLPLVDCEEDVEEMCQHPDSSSWSDPLLEAALRQRLGPAYHIYLDLVADMGKQLGKIRKILDIEPGHTAWLVDPNFNWKHQYKRLRICFMKTRAQKYATTLEKDNKAIARLLKTEEALGEMRLGRRSKSTIGVFLQKVRVAASQLYDAISKGWICDCVAHNAVLRLEQRPAARSSRGEPIARKEDMRFVLIFSHANGAVNESIASWTETVVVSQSTTGLQPDGMGKAALQSPSALAELQQNIKSVQISSPSTKQAKKVAWAAVGPAELSDPPLAVTRLSNNHIKDLCSTLGRCSDPSTCIGYLATGSDRRYFLTQWQKPALDRRRFQSLDQALVQHGQNSCSLSITHRVQLAVAIASNVLQLWGTPWMGHQINKQDLRIWPASQQTLHSYVHAVFDSRSCESHQLLQINAVNRTRELLLRLAIVLLELCFGETLESQPMRAQYSGPNGQPSDLTDRMTAIKWQEAVLGSLGPKYATAVSCCIDCRFGISEPNLDDAAFRQSVYANVVEPLQEIAGVLS